MNSDAPTFEKEKGRWFFFFAKLAFFLIVFFAVLIAILSSLGGKSDVLKTSVEEFLSARFGGVAKVETLHQMTFYPYIGADFEGVTITRRDNESQMMLNADRVSVAMGFWDIAFGTGKLKTFHVENLRAVPGVLLGKGVSIDRLAVIDEGDKAFARGQGKIGSAPFTIEAEMEKTGSGRSKKYKFGEVRPFTVSLDDMVLLGRVENISADMLTLAGLELERAGKTMINGTLDLYYGGDYRLKTKGTLTMMGGSKIHPDILFELGGEQTKLSGTLDINPLNENDYSDYRQYITLYNDVKALVGREQPKTVAGAIVLAIGNGFIPRSALDQKLQIFTADQGNRVKFSCILADTVLENGIADISAIIMRSPPQSFVGSGQYEFSSDTLTLTPDSNVQDKNAAFAQLKRKAVLPEQHPCLSVQ